MDSGPGAHPGRAGTPAPQGGQFNEDLGFGPQLYPMGTGHRRAERSAGQRVHRRHSVARVCGRAVGDDAGARCFSSKERLLYRGWTAARTSASWGSIPRPNDGLGTVGGVGQQRYQKLVAFDYDVEPGARREWHSLYRSP